MSTNHSGKRFEFGRNWHRFVKRNFNEDRLNVAHKHILAFAGRSDLIGLEFLDIGCGSGLHSYAALRAGARRILSFDCDASSVRATMALRKHAGEPENWTVEHGDVLDDAYLDKLGTWSFVYSWGVLHHTGDMWRALRNAQRTVANNGFFYIALYSADVQPDKEFWLDVKREYNRSNALKKQALVYWYIWNYGMGRDIKRLPAVVNQILTYRFKRGMNYFTDVRDWLGGWPMEFAADQDAVDFLEGEHGFKLVNVATGHANSEFLFQRTGSPAQRTIVTTMVSEKR